MADHPRLEIQKVICAHLASMSTVDGYDYTLSPSQVRRGVKSFGSEQTLPFLSVMEDPRIAPGQYAGEGEARSYDMVLLIQGWANDDKTNPTDPLYDLLKNVESRLGDFFIEGKPLYHLPDESGRERVVSFVLTPPQVLPATSEPVAAACFYLQVRVGLASVG